VSDAAGTDATSIAPISGGPLRGVRVVDVTTTFMGPYCTRQMARMGADVIKVEEPSGDVVRGIMDPAGRGLGPIFLAANQGKRSIALDLKDPRGRETLLQLIATADVFITNMRPTALERLRLSVETVHEANPRCIVASLVGFGPGGPYAGLAAYDDVIQAISGMAATQGAGGSPEYVRSAVADKVVGLMALNAILAALHERDLTGTGTVVTVPMFETMADFTLLDHQGGRVYEPPTGPTGYSRLLSPYRRPYATTDGYLAVVVYTDRMWLSFFDLIGQPDLAENPRYRTITDRTRNIDELYQLVETQLATNSSEYWLETLAAAGIPAVRVLDLDGVLADEHLAAVGFFERVEHPVAGSLRLSRDPVSFSDHVPPELRPAPLLGQHSREVALEAGFTAAEVDELLALHVLIEPQGGGA